MHLLMILLGISTAWLLRQAWSPSHGSWQTRWNQALRTFVLPPVVLLMTAIAVICMGRQGWMVFGQEGWFYVWVALGYGMMILTLLLHLGWQSWQFQRRLKQRYPLSNCCGEPCRLLNTPILYSAQVGLWQPELLVSQGLVDVLNPEHLQAVLCHEQAHRYYHDTFWFFGLGWLRRCTFWLPQTEALWQELLLLREMRADRWAAQYTDPLLLAEALLTVVRSPAEFPSEFCAAFGEIEGGRDRFTERIEAIFEPEASQAMPQPSYGWLLWGLLPLLLVPFHS
ncbi:MAG: M56 family peptidase [Spirulina sp. SIO3F2]|nr:M56 family peptidase [Spirulina sp. SIO3F2]